MPTTRAPWPAERHSPGLPVNPRNWAGWDSTSADTTQVQLTSLVPDQEYMFCVVAFDEAGAYSPVFSRDQNMLYFRVTFAGPNNPKIPFFNEFFQEFTPGNTLEFTVELTTLVDPGPQPDQFSFAILDCDLFEIQTEGPADALLLADIDSALPVLQSFAGDQGRASGCGGAPIPLPPPVVVLIPEPGVLALVGGGLVLLFAGPARRARGPR